MEKNTIVKITLAAILLLLGVILVAVIADQTNGITSLTTKTETISLAPARLAGGTLNSTYPLATLKTGLTDWRKDSSACIPTTIVYKNSSGDAQTATTDYVYTSATGALTVNNVLGLNGSTSNTTTASYNYCPDGYQTSSFGSAIVKLVGGFFALLVFGAAVALLYSVYNDVK